ncbi:hypothetical protein NHF46_04670 [Arthrobacter alpinus]|nr:hypothetical protein [Arthrobacter alpinus]
MRVQADLNYSVTPFEVQEDIVVHDGRPSQSDDYSEATRVRSIISIDPDASTSNPTFPSRNTPRAGASFTAPPQINNVPGVTGSGVNGPGVSGSTGNLTRNGQTVPSQDTTGGATVPKSYSNIASPTAWNDTGFRTGAPAQNPIGQNQAAQNQLGQHHAASSHVLDQTVGRNELLAPAADAQVPELEPAKKKGMWLGMVSGLVLVAAVVVAIVVFLNVGAPDKIDTVVQPTAPPTALVVGSDVPQVTDLAAKPINGGAEWTWKIRIRRRATSTCGPPSAWWIRGVQENSGQQSFCGQRRQWRVMHCREAAQERKCLGRDKKVLQVTMKHHEQTRGCRHG